MIFYYVAISKLLYQFFWLIAALAIPIALRFTALAVKKIAIDVIEVYSRWQTTRADIAQRQLNDKFIEDSRRVKLQVWQREARQRLTQQRTALQLGSEAMWKMGVFDVEISDDTISA